MSNYTKKVARKKNGRKTRCIKKTASDGAELSS